MSLQVINQDEQKISVKLQGMPLQYANAIRRICLNGVRIFAIDTVDILENSSILADEGINATIVDMHTIKPLDCQLIDKLVVNCGALVTAEDHNVIGGLGSAVAEYLVSNTYAPLEMVGVQDRFGESGQADEMLDLMNLSAPYIADAARRAIGRK